MADYYELENMLKSFRCQDLANLLAFAGQSKNGKKSELYDKCINILKKGSVNIQSKIREIYESRSASSASSASNYNNYLASINSGSSSSKSNSPDSNILGLPVSNSRFQSSYTGGFPTPNNFGPLTGSIPMQLPGTNYISSQLRSSTNINHQPIRVQFEKLAFYKLLHELNPPIRLLSNTTQRIMTHSFTFSLNLEQCNQITLTRGLINGKVEYMKQIHLRFGFFETTLQVDSLPPNLIVNVNGKPANLPTPKPTSKPNADVVRPGRTIEITSLTKLAPNSSNRVEVSWTNPDPAKSCCVGVYIFEKINVDVLVNKLKESSVKSADFTRDLIKQKLSIGDSDLEIETNTYKVSLMCPLMKFRMQIPSRSSKCQHAQCFNLESYLQMNEKKPTWNCPVCDQQAPYDTLIIDSLFIELLKKCPDCEEVEFTPDGEWHKIVAKEKLKKSTSFSSSKPSTSNSNNVVNEIEMDDHDDDNDDESSDESNNYDKNKSSSTTTTTTTTTTPTTVAAPVADKCMDIIDLTCDSDEESDKNKTTTTNSKNPINTTNTTTNSNLINNLRPLNPNLVPTVTSNFKPIEKQPNTKSSAKAKNRDDEPSSPSIISISSSDSSPESPSPTTINKTISRTSLNKSNDRFNDKQTTSDLNLNDNQNIIDFGDSNDFNANTMEHVRIKKLLSTEDESSKSPYQSTSYMNDKERTIETPPQLSNQKDIDALFDTDSFDGVNYMKNNSGGSLPNAVQARSISMPSSTSINSMTANNNHAKYPSMLNGKNDMLATLLELDTLAKTNDLQNNFLLNSNNNNNNGGGNHSPSSLANKNFSSYVPSQLAETFQTNDFTLQLSPVTNHGYIHLNQPSRGQFSPNGMLSSMKPQQPQIPAKKNDIGLVNDNARINKNHSPRPKLSQDKILKGAEVLGIRPNSPINSVLVNNNRPDLAKDTSKSRYPLDYQPTPSSSAASSHTSFHSTYNTNAKSIASNNNIHASPHHGGLPVANRLIQSSSTNNLPKYPPQANSMSQVSSSFNRNLPSNSTNNNSNNNNNNNNNLIRSFEHVAPHQHHHNHPSQLNNKQYIQSNQQQQQHQHSKTINPQYPSHVDHHHHSHQFNTNYNSTQNQIPNLYNNTNNSNFNRSVAQNSLPNYSSHRTQNATGSKY